MGRKITFAVVSLHDTFNEDTGNRCLRFGTVELISEMRTSMSFGYTPWETWSGRHFNEVRELSAKVKEEAKANGMEIETSPGLNCDPESKIFVLRRIDNEWEVRKDLNPGLDWLPIAENISVGDIISLKDPSN